MKRIASSIAGMCLAALAVFAVPTPAAAIVNGSPDGDAHPYVGVLVSDYMTSGYLQRFCSALLVAPKILVTAAHCAEYPISAGGLDHMWVSFESIYTPGRSKVYHGTMVIDPKWVGTGNWNGETHPRHDLAVVHLDENPGIAPAALPTIGLLNSVAVKGARFTLVGYGRTREGQSGSPNRIEGNWDPDVRNAATSTFKGLEPYVMWLSSNPATGNGGGCYGDSGSGPLIGGSDVLTGIYTSVVPNCRNMDGFYRLDTEIARSFLATQGVPVP
jgi:Trypsin